MSKVLIFATKIDPKDHFERLENLMDSLEEHHQIVKTEAELEIRLSMTMVWGKEQEPQNVSSLVSFYDLICSK